jgi:hypothetical protein
MKTALIILALSALLTNNLFGQKGYKPGFIVTNDGDTIQGTIQVKNNISFSRQCPFLAAGSETPTIYSPLEISAFRIDESKYYVATDLVIDNKKERLFLEYLVDGIVDLYYLREPGRELYFIKKDTVFSPLTNAEKKIIITDRAGFNERDREYSGSSNSYKRTLNYLFQESPETRKKLENVNFQYKSLIGITKEYHKNVCTEYECIDYSRQTKTPLLIEISGGLQSSFLALDKSSDRLPDLHPSFGIRLRVKPFKGFSKFDILTGLVYNKNSFNGDMDNTLYSNFGYVKTYNIDLEYTALQVPVSIERSFGNSRLSPFISLGVSPIFILKSEHVIMRTDQSDFEEYSPFRKVWYGFTGGAGFRYSPGPNKYIFFRTEGEYRIPYAEFGWILDHTKVFSVIFTAGYAFKIN